MYLPPFPTELPQVHATPRKFCGFSLQVAWMSRYSNSSVPQASCFETRRTCDALLEIAPVLSFYVLFVTVSFGLSFSFSRALAFGDGNVMRRLSLRSGEASILAHALALWIVDACLYFLQEVKEAQKANSSALQQRNCNSVVSALTMCV